MNKRRMPKAKKQAWIDALKSGDYKQGESVLYSNQDDTYCCLGVYCVAVGNVLKKGVNLHDLETEWIVNLSEKYTKSIPKVLKEHHQAEDGIVMHLANMNDGAIDIINPEGLKHSFTEIADWIDENIYGV